MKKIFISAFLLSMAVVSCSDDAESTQQIYNEEASVTDVKLKNASVDPKEVMEDFMLYKATITFPRVESSNPKETKTAKSFALISYSELISTTYTIDGDEYNDLGLGNDLLADDGIYTSGMLYDAEKVAFDYDNLRYNISPDFTEENLMIQEFKNGTLAKRKPGKGGGAAGVLIQAGISYLMGCDYSYTFSGSSSLGVPCKYGGCLIVDC